ncbi:MAG: cytochrome c [Deltaproteobacteria bacterium]|nr:cytochrome c [Deltaproteobacteria bacterium]
MRSGRALGASLGVAALAATVVVGACGNPQTTIGSSDDIPEDQWSRGVYLYGQHCSSCHGENGEGDEDTPALAGEGAFAHDAPEGSSREVPFDTAADVVAYVKEEMPALEPGSLSDDVYWTTVAYALKQAGIDIGSEDPGPANGKTVKLR